LTVKLTEFTFIGRDRFFVARFLLRGFLGIFTSS